MSESGEDDDIRALRAKPEAEKILLGIPGVRGVGFGGKVSGGRPVGQFAYLVYVEEKKPPDQVPAGEMIPRLIEGFPTDVLQAGKPEQHLGSIQGGIDVSVKYQDAGLERISLGTLGCIARTSNVPDNQPPNILLSNYHVLYAGLGTNDAVLLQGTGVGANVFYLIWHFVLATLGCGDTTLGHVKAGKYDGLVDAAIATFEPGFDLRARVHNEAVTGILDLRPQAFASLPQAVRDKIQNHTFSVHKYGSSTDLTRGYVKSIDEPTDAFVDENNKPVPARSHQLFIGPRQPPDRFSTHGDSGSVVLDDNGKIVGLLWGGGVDVKTGQQDAAYVNHIGDVIDALKIKIATNPPVGTWHVGESPAVRSPDSFEHDVASVGLVKMLPALFRRHLDEIRQLARGEREVTATWSRWRGSLAVQALHDLSLGRIEALPEQLDDQPWQVCAERIADVLVRRGSIGLRADTEAIRPLVAGLGGCTYREVLARLSAFDTALIASEGCEVR